MSRSSRDFIYWWGIQEKKQPRTRMGNHDTEDTGGKKGISPEEVLQLTKPCAHFLCPLEANTYKIEFLDFEVIDDASSEILFKVQRELDAIPGDEHIEDEEDEEESTEKSEHALESDGGNHDDELEEGMRALDIDENDKDDTKASTSRADEMRTIRYSFPRDFLDLSNIRTHLKFCVNQTQMPVENFRMIERHYFKDKLIRYEEETRTLTSTAHEHTEVGRRLAKPSIRNLTLFLFLFLFLYRVQVIRFRLRLLCPRIHKLMGCAVSITDAEKRAQRGDGVASIPKSIRFILLCRESADAHYAQYGRIRVDVIEVFLYHRCCLVYASLVHSLSLSLSLSLPRSSMCVSCLRCHLSSMLCYGKM